jgi:hypothetical protein
LNRASEGRTIDGRRPGLASSAAEAIVQVWIDDALELMHRMPYTCSLDVVEDYPDGLSASMVAWLFGVTEQSIAREQASPGVRAATVRLREYADE